ncbi:hypothetical protein JKF63_03525 [Porcisia hertigi]|uniref:Uncharacterized protein n=1 Tax=Porcisia hertigi TaxID=2761500 RepID=A0A836I8J6_9TRYP|nr:hypothetical protein JKF63_03525 [Porcisia hertigi]
MFFSGGTFGSASEARDANKRPSGRRHQPRDMAEVQANIDADTGILKTSAEGARRSAAQKNMASGPSFLDRMFEHSATIVESSNPTRRRGSAPADHLNIFSWQNNPPASRGPGQGHAPALSEPRAGRPVVATAALPTAEDRRAVESKKFESNRDGVFLRFTDDPKTKGKADARDGGARPGAEPGKPVTSFPTGGDMGGSLMRGESLKVCGRRGKAAAPASNKRGMEEGSGVAGFPGMGERSAPRAVPRLTRKPVESNVFPQAVSERAQQGSFSEDHSARLPPPPTPAPKAESVPSYLIEDQDYEDRRYTNACDAGAYGRQPQTQTIEMDDDDDEGYGYDDHAYTDGPVADAPHHPEGGHHPEWLRAPSGGVSPSRFPANSPSVQPRRYNFDTEGKLFCQGDVPS